MKDFSFAQLVVNSLAIEEYVQDILLGSGIQATNISFTGCPSQIGYMTGGASAGLGIDGGLVLTSDDADNIEVPNPFEPGPDFSCSSMNDNDLLAIANSVPPLIGQNFTVSSIEDKCILEFDFIPTGDTLRFNYIFGSDEYLTWVNSSYNDIFAFFLSGPGISGPFDSPPGFPGGAVNIATLPNTNPPLPITISSVNNVTNSAYYIDNQGQSTFGVNGYTVLLEAMHPVSCGETYHIKLAIADGSDASLKSIVVLEEGSFSSNAVVDVGLSIDVGGPEAETIYEDCGLANLTFTRAEVSDLTLQDMVVLTWSGQAVMGADYNMMPDTIIFPPGVSSVSLSVDAVEDGISEGSELVVLDILNLAACNGSGLVSNFEFYIGDEPNPLVVEGFDTQICAGASATLEPVITGGYGNFHYEWSTGETTPEIDVSPLTPTTYYLTVSDTCGMPPDDASFFLDILVFPPLDVQIDNSDLLINCNEQVFVTATASGGDGVYSYQWFDDEGNELFGWDNTLWYGSWNGAGQLTVEVTDGCGLSDTDAINVALNVPELIVDVPATLEVQCNVPFTVTANVSGGETPYFYSWYLNNVPDWNQWSNVYQNTINSPGTLEVEVGDNCGQIVTGTIALTVASPAIDLVLVDQVTGTCVTPFVFVPEVSAGSGGFQYTWTENGTSLGSGPTLNFSSDADTQVDLTVTDACGATASDFVIVDIENPPVTVDLGADVDASCLDNTLITPSVSGGSGGNAFQWTVDGLSQGTGTSFTIQSYETIEVGVVVEDVCGQTASDVMTIHIPDIPLTLSLAADTSVCLNGTALLWAAAGGGEGNFTYFWPDVNSANPEITVGSLVESETYEVIATDQCGHTIEGEVHVQVMPIEAWFQVDELGPSEYAFTALTQPECANCTYIWEFGDGASASTAYAEHQYDGLSNYLVMHTAINEIGCSDTRYFTIVSPPSVYLPNAFTPNGDGINDVFRVVANAVKEYELQIFNRWGEPVFSSVDPEEPWVGDHQGTGESYVPDGVYAYILKIKGFNSDAFEKSGNVVLIR